jgi:DNA polymerase III delta subunit
MKKLISLGQAVKNLRQKEFSNSYFLYGNDIFMQDFFIKQLQTIHSNFQSYLYYLGYDQQETIFNELSNTSLFDSNKIIIIKNINRFSAKAKKELIQYLTQTDFSHQIILVKNNFDSRNKFIDSIIKNTTSIDVRTPFENQMGEWIKYFSKLEKIDIDSIEIKNYIDSYGSNIANVMNYIRIDFLSKSYSNTDSNRTYHLWNFQDSIAKKQLNKSLNIYNSITTNGNSLNLILIYLFNLYYAIYLHSYYNSDLGFNYNFTINKIIQSRMNTYSKKYSQNEIENIILEINAIDFLSKNKSINTYNRILCLANNICIGYYDR